MKQRDPAEGVAMFVAVAQAGSFSAAARRLGISPSAVSQAIALLEGRLGTSLFRRSTRSLGLTDAGKDYLRATAPALAQLRQAADDAFGRAGQATGSLRLTMPRAPFDLLIVNAMAAFQKEYPGIAIEIAVEARLVDIVKEGYDAGLRYGNCLERDMAAVEVAPMSQAVLVASPSYLREHVAPARPGDLTGHRALMCRSQSTGQIIPWTLRCGGDTVALIPERPTIVHDLASQIELASRGAGIVSAPITYVARHLETGRLHRLLPEWSCRMEPIFLSHPTLTLPSAALRAFIAFLTARPNPTTLIELSTDDAS